MLHFLRPGLLWAGAAAALVPLLLHLIARRPPDRAALPTARFVTQDPRFAVRIRRRPTDPLLLVLRSTLLLLLGAAAAGPFRARPPTDRLELVLLDRGADEWSTAVDSARALLLDGSGVARGELVVFDSAATTFAAGAVTGAIFDSLAAAGPRAGRAPYAVALRELRAIAAARGGSDSARVTLVTEPRWSGWSPGLAWLRAAAWNGPLRLVAIAGTPGVPAAAPSAGRGRATVVAGEGGGGYVSAAVGALGYEAAAGGGELTVILARGAPVRPARGGVVLVAGEAAAAGWDATLPWALAERSGTGLEEAGRSPGALALDDGTVIQGASVRARGGPRPGARLLAAWDDGRPAAAAARVGEGCLVFLATPLEEGSLPLSPRFPALLDRLARGCEGDANAAAPDRPLDRGAVALLEGDRRLPVPRLEAGEDARSDEPLGRWFFLGALAVALAETGLAYGRGRR